MGTSSNATKTIIAVDALGGDAAPAAVTAGVEQVLADTSDIQIALTGYAEIVLPLAERYPDRLLAIPTTEFIDMNEHPAKAVHAKKDSSIVVGCRLVKEGRADGFFSAGSTGACMTAATLVIGRIKGIVRPAIATLLPASTGSVVLLDAGANAEVRADMYLQFAQMGEIYAREVLGISKPRIGLLNIGSEATKGSTLTQEAYALLSAQLPSFSGNIEGTELLAGTHDVVVTDGFTGNVVLKTLEGTASALFAEMKQIFAASLKTKIAAGLVQANLRELKNNLSAEKAGGAPLLGCKAAVLIGHGSSNPNAIANGIKATAEIARAKVPELIATHLLQSYHDSAEAQGVASAQEN